MLLGREAAGVDQQSRVVVVAEPFAPRPAGAARMEALRVDAERLAQRGCDTPVEQVPPHAFARREHAVEAPVEPAGVRARGASGRARGATPGGEPGHLLEVRMAV